MSPESGSTEFATDSFLRSCAAIYDVLVDLTSRIASRANSESALECIQAAAHFAWHFHCGRYSDGRLENLALELGQHLDQLVPSSHTSTYMAEYTRAAGAPGRRRVLHVATTALPVGGHTRWMRDWINGDPGSRHSVLLIRQGNTDVPDWLVAAVARNNGELISLPDAAPLLVRARLLRDIARSIADVVVLFHHPDDVVPTVAFGAHGGPPVALYNHADHVFWLGGSVADCVVNFRTSGLELSEERRRVRRNSLLPCPLGDKPLTLTRQQAREQLKISDGKLMVLSVGTAYKYTPTRTRNYFNTSLKMLSQNPHAHLYLVGVGRDANKAYLRDVKHERLHFVGRIEDPTPFQAAADVYLEGFPFTSLTALLETVRFGVPAVPAFGNSGGVLTADDPALAAGFDRPRDEPEYLERIQFLLSRTDERIALGRELRRRVEECHAGDGWRRQVESLYSHVGGLRHEPAPIAATQCLTADRDRALSEFQESTSGRAGVSTFLLQNLKLFAPAGLWRAGSVSRHAASRRGMFRTRIWSSLFWDGMNRMRKAVLRHGPSYGN